MKSGTFDYPTCVLLVTSSFNMLHFDENLFSAMKLANANQAHDQH
jgi:hypothetical protein